MNSFMYPQEHPMKQRFVTCYPTDLLDHHYVMSVNLSSGNDIKKHGVKETSSKCTSIETFYLLFWNESISTLPAANLCPVLILKPIFKSEGDNNTTRQTSRSPSSDINQTWVKSAFLFLQGVNILYYYSLHLDQSWQPSSHQSKPPTTSSSISSWPTFDFFILCKNILRLCANN